MEIDTSIASSNRERRRVGIDMLVIHATAGSARSALAWLTNPAAKVSAHFVIDKTGRIYQLVPDELAAWHAGRAAWRGATDINAISLGIKRYIRRYKKRLKRCIKSRLYRILTHRNRVLVYNT